MGLITPRQRKHSEVNVQGWLQESIKKIFSLYTGTDETTRELRFDIRQQLGTYRVHRRQNLSKSMRQSLGRSNIVCGKHYLYHKDIYKTRFQVMRFLLYGLWNDVDLLPEMPEQRTAFKATWPVGMARALGYYQYAGWTIRADVVDKIRWANATLTLHRYRIQTRPHTRTSRKKSRRQCRSNQTIYPQNDVQRNEENVHRVLERKPNMPICINYGRSTGSWKNFYARRVARHLDWLGHRTKVFNVEIIVEN